MKLGVYTNIKVLIPACEKLAVILWRHRPPTIRVQILYEFDLCELRIWTWSTLYYYAIDQTVIKLTILK